jgi:hypothetical protein
MNGNWEINNRAEALCMDHKGDPSSLLICLKLEFEGFYKRYVDDKDKQAELVRDYEAKLYSHEVEKTLMEKSIKDADEEIKKIIERIEYIKDNPRDVLNERPSAFKLIILSVIGFFLTAYLILFYASAIYIAFFKKFSPDDPVGNEVFDPTAIINAYRDGGTTLLYMLIAPVVVFAFAYSIHLLIPKEGLSQDSVPNYKKIQGYLVLFAVVVVVFMFDALVAFKLTENVYLSKRRLFDPQFSLPIGLRNINFWLVLFLGFIATVFWGVIVYFWEESWEHYNILKYMIKRGQDKIHKLELLRDEYNARLSMLSIAVSKMENIIHTGIIRIDDYKKTHASFMQAWIRSIDLHKLGDENKMKSIEVGESYLDEVMNKFENININ